MDRRQSCIACVGAKAKLTPEERIILGLVAGQGRALHRVHDVLCESHWSAFYEIHVRYNGDVRASVAGKALKAVQG